MKYESRGWNASWLAPQRCVRNVGRSGCAPQRSDYSQEWWCGHCSVGLYAFVKLQQLFVPAEACLPAVQAHPDLYQLHLLAPYPYMHSNFNAVWKLCLLLPPFAWWRRSSTLLSYTRAVPISLCCCCGAHFCKSIFHCEMRGCTE